ncbi:MAG: glycosyltransferase family A protein [Coleofasciculus sp. G3-WIS-01]|uniref:glycosyltransferase family 2 protein n=1 Tax=Coleofasciculus sp. G3-WIS-01 TaxID=3069528 RepID=UPI0032FFD636
MPFFSTIIPVFNRANLIELTLNSVLNQEFDDQEIIVVDDGSTDNTLDVLAGYGDQIKVLKQENKGPGAARNLGIHHACGKYITFLDSDDLWFPWTLSTYAQVIHQHRLPAFITGTESHLLDEDEMYSVCPLPLQAKYFPDYYASSQQPLWIGTCAAAIRSDVLREVAGFTEKRINAEDSDLWLKLGIAPGFVYIHSPPVFIYRRHGNSATANRAQTYRGSYYLINQERNAQYPGTKIRKIERIKILTRHLRPVSLECLRQGDIKKGMKLYRDTLLWHIQLMRIRYLLGLPLIAIFLWFRYMLQRQLNYKL